MPPLSTDFLINHIETPIDTRQNDNGEFEMHTKGSDDDTVQESHRHVSIVNQTEQSVKSKNLMKMQ